MTTIKNIYLKIVLFFRKIYRLNNPKKSKKFVWKELVRFFKKSELKYGQYENDKYISCSFLAGENDTLEFEYIVNNKNLIYKSIILPNFDEEQARDILVLASHFNSLLQFGSIKVSSNHNYVEFIYTRDLLVYSLFPNEIEFNMHTHFDLTKDIFWAFKKMIETKEDPVFIISELLSSRENNKKED